MKLYTEEQVRQAYNASIINGYSQGIEKENNLINSILPIKLPNDEEIKDKSFNKFTQSNARICFEEGAKWMREQILGKEDKTFKQKSKWTEVDNMTRRLK